MTAVSPGLTAHASAVFPDGWWLRAVAPGDRTSGVRPEWARFVEEAVARDEPLVLPDGELPGLTGFAALMEPFARHAARPLPEQERVAASVRARWTEELAGRLAGTAARALVLELHTAGADGRTEGDTPGLRFRSFLRLSAQQCERVRLFVRYPVLGRLVGQIGLYAAAAFSELLERFAADRALIVAGLLHGTDPGELVEVHGLVGDGHRQGRGVAVLRFATGRRVVHKPRPLAVDRRFAGLLRWFDARSGLPALRVPAVVERPGHGWAEFVAPGECRTTADVDRFYLRLGGLLALTHAVGGTDLHHENLVACRDEPVLVDVETLFHPPEPAAGRPDPAEAALEASVHRTGLLPRLWIGDADVRDVSGVGGDPGVATPLDVVGWAGAGTDTMRLVRVRRPLAGGENRPRLGGAVADPAEHLGALLAGFRAGYRTLLAHRDELLRPGGPLALCADDEVRVVVRATQVYATLLDESTHPDLLRGWEERDVVLGALRDGDGWPTGRPELVEDEIAELWNGDVPLFTARPGRADLWTASGRRVAGALGRPGLDVVTERIRAMGPQDRARQEWIVRAAMAGRSRTEAHGGARPPLPRVVRRTPAGRCGPPHRPGTWSRPDPGRLLDAARTIGDRLLMDAYRGAGTANWLGLELLGDRYWRLQPLGADLGSGWTGVALFLARLAHHTGQERYAEAAREALRPLPGLLAALARRPDELGHVGSGGFAGLGGIAYAAASVASCLDDAEVRGLVEPAVALVGRAIEREEESGVAGGTAGGLAALLAVDRMTGSAPARRAAALAAERLLDAPPPVRPGFADGRAGVGWALLRYAEAGGDARYGRAGAAALRVAALRAAADGRAGGPPGWCRGAPGVALALADTGQAAADAVLSARLASAVRAAHRDGPLPAHGLCHGESGVLELLFHPAAAPGAAGRPTGARTATGAGAWRAAAVVSAVERGALRYGTPGGTVVPGLLHGLAGTGYTLLRLGFAARVPSVLLLRSPGDGPPAGAGVLPAARAGFFEEERSAR
ncbi:type 2 lanthipeptide synthetase LanM family protein [Streptomyces sp. NBC_00102]|uniref:type 2 lanthipeptide synthetase LanM family protein n=1 Tax=Streptomyces sp. NBC_00102 TaxID=2975652 RepID=UPI00225746EA|nr:type 2 lanthipeptide synthetase LanM family protein [Streptomyces sp. NBC_00102]MCX5398676.1 type 2 lanthipeptide synthetase LanM family protein [Streptomyces sp. NBC_00102]